MIRGIMEIEEKKALDKAANGCTALFAGLAALDTILFLGLAILLTGAGLAALAILFGLAMILR